LLHHFFEHKRAINRLTATPLREDALRTPDVRFRYLLDYPWTPRYVSDLKTLSGLRMHYLDENPDTNILPIFLCLHGYRHWSYVFRKMVPTLSKAGHRIVVPDLIGFGKSDKPKREAVHTMAFHQQVLFEFIERLDLHNVILIVQEDIELLAQFLMQGSATRFRGIFKVSKTQSTHEAPFPDDGHRAAVRALSSGESDSPTSSEPDESVAREVLCLFAA
jgi:tRNA(adenine34) deaminase